MADGSAALLPSGGGSSPFSGALSAGAALTSKAQQVSDNTSDSVSKLESDRTAGHDAIEAQRDKVLPPEAPKPTPPPTSQSPTDPVKQWGSAAMVLGLLASAMTRRPFDTALQAATGVMNAYHKGDAEAAQTAFDHWKITNDYALKMQEFQNQSYQKIMAGLDRREHMVDQEVDSRERALMYPLRAQAVANGDAKFVALLDTQGVKAAMQYQEHQQTLTERMRENTGKVADQAMKQQAMYEAHAALHDSPEYQAAPPTKKAAMDLALVTKFDHPAIGQMTAAQTANLEVKLHKELDTTGVGKPYIELQNKWPVINEAERSLKEHGQLNAQESVALVDGFQRIYTNTAVRQGLVALNTAHAPLMDQLSLEASRWQSNGGGVLAPHQAADLLAILHEYRDNITTLRKNQVDEYRDLATGVGANPDIVANPRYHDSVFEQHDQQAHGAPPAMKQNPQNVLSAGVGVPVTITSNGRSPEHNAAVGGSPTSEHLGGNAWDFIPHGISPEVAAGRLAQNMRQHNQPFDQIEFTPNHVHIGFGPKNRGEVIDQNGRHFRLDGTVGGASKPSATAHYADPAAVKAAVQAGTLPREQALKILQSQFGMG